MTPEQVKKLIAQINSAMSQAAIEGAWQTQAQLGTIKAQLEKLKN